MEDDDLRRLIEQRASLASIAREMQQPVSAVRSRLSTLGLRTARMERLELGRTSRTASVEVMQADCPTHGPTEHRRDARGTHRCASCNGQRVADRRRRIKELLVEEAGGRCCRCGYDRCLRALAFHHSDPATKAFGIAYQGMSRSLDRARAEAAKCVLLCANCHAEVEAAAAGKQ